MNMNRLYVDFHIIQTVPPSCVNRDDTGRPKTAFYGGANRARVSSQAWKHAMRKYFSEKYDTGYRTKYMKDLILSIIADKDPENDLKEAGKTFDKILKTKLKESKKEWIAMDGDKTKAIFFISRKQAEAFAELLMQKESDVEKYREALEKNPAIDMALFGRMVANDNYMNIDAAAQVAHSISTHTVQNEYDFYTAVDDCKEEAGAEHLDTMEFNSATLYRYATVNVCELLKTIGDDTADALCGFAEAIIRSMPTGKQNSYANKTLPDLVYVTVRSDQPVNLCGAFEKPVSGADGFSEKSIKALFEHAKKVYEDYCGAPIKSYVIGCDSILGAEKMNLNGLLDALRQINVNEVI
ncbi:MAG TPA: type I-E CRISPR-associated protein Cas7/Cse4/CasC [Ruminococcus sp.]|nr:type I-E CRISPR-associated protein Cas7/Cse4/CasC [Ruminococcus sp.]